MRPAISERAPTSASTSSDRRAARNTPGGKARSSTPWSIQERLQGRMIARRVLGEHLFVHGARSGCNDGTKIRWQRRPGVLAHDELERRSGLLPAR